MHQSVTDPKYESVRTSRKQLMESEEEDDSGDDDEESHQEGDEEDEEESEDDEDENEERHVRFDILSEEQPWKSNGAVSDDDVPSECEDGNEEYERGKEDITSNGNTPSKQPFQSVGPTEDMSSTLKKKREEDLQKGQAVNRQVVCLFVFSDDVGAR